MLTIHGRATSSHVQLVMWAVNELGLPHRRLDVGGAFGGTDTAEYRAMNPNGLVPVMRDKGQFLWESAAIVRYLGAAYGDEKFWPADPLKLIWIVSSGRPAPPHLRVNTLPSMVPVVRLTLRMGRLMLTGVPASIAGRASVISVLSSARSRP